MEDLSPSKSQIPRQFSLFSSHITPHTVYPISRLLHRSTAAGSNSIRERTPSSALDLRHQIRNSPQHSSSPFMQPIHSPRLSLRSKDSGPPPPSPRKNGLTAVQLKQMTTIEEDEIRPPPSKCCCDRISVQTACRFVAFLSLLAAIANAALYCFGLSRLGLSAAAEIIIMLLDFIAALCLLIGATNGSPSMLKPYLFFMTAWSLGLILLLISCIWKLITNRNFPNNAVHTLMDFNRSGDFPRVRHARHGQEGFELLLTFCLLAALGFIIFIDCVFLHVAYRAFQHFAYKRDRAKDEERSVV